MIHRISSGSGSVEPRSEGRQAAEMSPGSPHRRQLTMSSDPGHPSRLFSLPVLVIVAILGWRGFLQAAPSPVAPALACPSCDDMNPCTTDSCDTTTGFCRHDPVSCDDGNSCTDDRCDAFPLGGCR